MTKETLEFLDWLVDNVTLAANHPDFENQARVIAAAKREVGEALTAAGGVPLSQQRLSQ